MCCFLLCPLSSSVHCWVVWLLHVGSESCFLLFVFVLCRFSLLHVQSFACCCSVHMFSRLSRHSKFGCSQFSFWFSLAPVRLAFVWWFFTISQINGFLLNLHFLSLVSASASTPQTPRLWQFINFSHFYTKTVFFSSSKVTGRLTDKLFYVQAKPVTVVF